MRFHLNSHIIGFPSQTLKIEKHVSIRPGLDNYDRYRRKIGEVDFDFFSCSSNSLFLINIGNGCQKKVLFSKKR